MTNCWRTPLRGGKQGKTGRVIDAEFLAEWRRHNHASRATSRKEREEAQHVRRLKWLAVTKAMQRGEPS